nr:uncharacterized protein LOC124817232 [Hydra vulgaris]
MLHLILDQSFQSKVITSQLALLTDVNEDLTSIISKIIVPYKNILLFDCNSNNYKLTYGNNSVGYYYNSHKDSFIEIVANFNVTKYTFVIITTDVNEIENYDILSSMNEYVNSTEFCLEEYTVHYLNTSYMTAIAKKLGPYVRNIFVTFNSLDGFLSFFQICTKNNVTFGRVIGNTIFENFFGDILTYFWSHSKMDTEFYFYPQTLNSLVNIASYDVINLIRLVYTGTEYISFSDKESKIIIIKDSKSEWFQNNIRETDFIGFANVSNLFQNETYESEKLMAFTSYNYTTLIEILLHLILDQSFQSKFITSQLALLTDVNEELTSIMSNIIVPFNNVLLFDCNSNNYKMTYDVNETEKYDILSSMKQYVNNTEFCFIEYTVHYTNISYMTAIAKNLGPYVKNIFKQQLTKCNTICPPAFEQKLLLVTTNEEKIQSRICTSCQENFFKVSYGTHKCEKCPLGYTSNKNRTACILTFGVDLTFQCIEGIIITLIAAFSTMIGLIIAVTFILNRNTPVLIDRAG